jgi:hypothetical protein
VIESKVEHKAQPSEIAFLYTGLNCMTNQSYNRLVSWLVSPSVSELVSISKSVSLSVSPGK